MTQDADWERLYRDTRHRIGNTMQMLLSLLRLQMRRADPPVQAALQRLEVRMSAAAAAYALARVTADEAGGGAIVVDVDALVRNMVEEARRQVETDMAPDVTLDLSPVEMPLERSIPLAIALTEILVNAVEHGGPPITVSLDAVPDEGMLRLVVSDGGKGVPEHNLRKDGLGLRIAESLMRQVQGRLVLDDGPVRLEWPV